MKTRKERAGVCRILRSQRGASILFALFLFLICAVVGSVVLTAGTAAAGRRSQIAQVDQRYYSVGSAEEVIRALIEEQTVTIVREMTTKEYTVYTLQKDADGHGHRIDTGTRTPGATTYDIYLSGSSDTLSPEDCERSILVDAAASLIPNSLSDPEAAYGAPIPTLSMALDNTYTLDHDTASLDDASGLAVTVKTHLHCEGDIAYLDVTFSSDGYALTDSFRLQLSEDPGGISVDGAPSITPDGTDISKYTESIVTTETETKTDSFRWVFEKQQIVQNEE